jgi:hypothetical protein
MIQYNGKEVIPKYNGNSFVKILKSGIILWEGIEDIPPASAYIQDGLVFHLDGIERGESGWTDLIGGKKFTLYNCTLNDDNVEFNGTSSYGKASGALNSDSSGTIEAVFTADNFVTTTDSFDLDVFYSGNSSGPNLQLVKYSGKEAIASSLSNQYKNSTDKVKTVSASLKSPYPGIINGAYTPKYTIKSLSRSSTSYMYVGHYSNKYLQGKIYSIRRYNRPLTEEERIHNQLLDIQRFKLPNNFETVKLTLASNDGGSVAGAKFMIGGSLCEYSGNTMTFKIPAGTYYQLNFSCIPNYRAPEGTEIFKAVAGNTRNITLVYTYNGFEDYFVTTGNYVNKQYTTEERDGITYYKHASPGSPLVIDESVTSVEHWSNTDQPYHLTIRGPKDVAPFINDYMANANCTITFHNFYNPNLLFPKLASYDVKQVITLETGYNIPQLGNLNQYAALSVNKNFDWKVQSGTWTSSSNTSASDGLEWKCSSPGNSGSTVIRCTFSGVTSITFYCYSGGEYREDYLTVGSLDTPCTRTSYYKKFDETSGTVTYTCDEGEHYVEFCYSKDASYSASTDYAKVYVDDYVGDFYIDCKDIVIGANTYTITIPNSSAEHNIYTKYNNYPTSSLSVASGYNSKKFNFVNLTHNSCILQYQFNKIPYDSTATEEEKESWRKTLVVNSLDRTGLETGASFKVYDSTNINYILTDDEVAQITAKGYTIA